MQNWEEWINLLVGLHVQRGVKEALTFLKQQHTECLREEEKKEALLQENEEGKAKRQQQW